MMNNIFDIPQKNGYKIIANDYAGDYECSSTAVICYLYYEDTLLNYYRYIDCIPNEVDVFLITSNSRVETQLKNKYDNCNNIKIIKKNNRGRDLSALLITSKPFILNYNYVCFIHDKKATDEKYNEDLLVWIEDLWDNIISSKEYIRNIVKFMDMNERIGLLVPPEQFGKRYGAWYRNAWMENYDNTIELAKVLKIKARIKRDTSPIALGSAFWARTAALKKLIEYKWSYEDFPDEPMPMDGTISHAIERIFPYVAEDAGYISQIVVSSDFAPRLLSFAQTGMRKAMSVLYDGLEIKNVLELQELENKKREIEYIFDLHRKVYLYGAGHSGRACIRFLRDWGYEPEGFVITTEPKTMIVEGKKVHCFNERYITPKDSYIIITLYDKKIREEIKSNLISAGYLVYTWHSLNFS